MPHLRTGHKLGRVLAILTVLATAAVGSAAVRAGAAVDGPVLDRDFPDPDIVRAGSTYHAYSTSGDGRNIRHAVSRDLTGWSVAEADALPVLGAWVDRDEPKVWAPEVYDNGSGFTMHYTARDRASGRQCIGAALSSSPDGPFRPVGDRPLVCPVELGGAIDPASYTEGGRRYLVWKNDGNCCGTGTWIHLQPTSWDGTRVTGEPVRLIRNDREWEGKIVEAPTLVRRDGRYVLFYSAALYSTDAYSTGYAVASRLTGPYSKAAEPLMTTDSFSGTVRGPGGQDVVTGPDGRDRIVFHGWSADRRQRPMYLAELGFTNGRPVVRGNMVRHQAEDAVVHRAEVREAVRASGGRAVGLIDHPDSYVEFTVFAASAGPHTLTVRYGNGSLDAGNPVAASHLLSVEGRDAGAARYPHTGWDNWRPAEVTVVLREGSNTVRLSKGENYAELDCLDVTWPLAAPAGAAR
ncbi:family 43 glycosylhydrolase [Streptomyces sp. NPDC002920]